MQVHRTARQLRTTVLVFPLHFFSHSKALALICLAKHYHVVGACWNLWHGEAEGSALVGHHAAGTFAVLRIDHVTLLVQQLRVGANDAVYIPLVLVL